MRKDFEGVKNEVGRLAGSMEAQGERIATLERSHEDVVQRLQKLEQGGSTRAGSSTSAGASESLRLGLIAGGWNQHSKKEDIIEQITKVSNKLGCAEHLDSEWFTTGIRRGFVLTNGAVRAGENLEEARRRLQKVAADIQAAKITLTGDDPATTYIWSGLQKAKFQRERSAHLGKIRKLLHELAPAALQLFDWEYGSGTAYLQMKIVASVSLPRPGDRDVVPGKLPGAWVDAISIAKAADLHIDEVKKKLGEFWREQLRHRRGSARRTGGCGPGSCKFCARF